MPLICLYVRLLSTQGALLNISKEEKHIDASKRDLKLIKLLS